MKSPRVAEAALIIIYFIFILDLYLYRHVHIYVLMIEFSRIHLVEDMSLYSVQACIEYSRLCETGTDQGTSDRAFAKQM